jgi:isopenicillin N synthase-like dioxygenase
MNSHAILNTMLSILSSALDLADTERLEQFHRLDGASGDHLRLVKYTPPSQTPASNISRSSGSVMLIPHTDFGTLTLLLTDTPGLQLMDPASKAWKYVAPHPGCAVVNVGDTLAKFTNGLFRSCQHRVVQVNETDMRRLGSATAAPALKYSLGYFLRPEDEVLLRRLESTLIPALMDSAAEEKILSKDWTDRRVNASKVSNFGKKTTWQDLRGTALVWV